MIKMMHERLYNNFVLIVADMNNYGLYRTLNNDISIELFIRSLVGHISAHQ